MFLNDFDLNKRVINVPPATHPLHTTLNISLHACVMAPRSGSADAAPPPWLSAPRAARAHGYNELLHRADWEPASEPSSEQQTHRHRPRATPAPPARSRMPGGKRGLVAPQNTFLENIVRRSSGESARRSEACFGGSGFGLTGWRLGPGLCWNTVCFYVSVITEVCWRINTQSLYTVFISALMEFTTSFRLHEGSSVTLSHVKLIQVSSGRNVRRSFEENMI